MSDDEESLAKQQEKRVIKIVEELYREVHAGNTLVKSISLDDTFDKVLGLDSLARVELVSRVEFEFKVTLPENAFADAETPRDLLRLIQETHLEYIDISSKRGESVESIETSEVPSGVETLVEMLEWHVTHHPKRAHIKFYQDDGGGDVISYEELQISAESVAASLQQNGMKIGDSVAIMLPTSKEYFFTFFGILIGGGIPVPIYPPARASQIEDHVLRHTRILKNCRAGILITVPEAVSIAHLLKSQVPTVEKVISASRLLITSEKLIRPTLHGDDIAFIQYTSGSTGDPKGVTLSHANLLANIRAMGEAVDASSKDVFISWLPLYHDMGLIGAWLGSLYFAAEYVVMSPLSFLARPQRWLWAIHHYRGTLSASPNFGYEYCLNRVDRSDFEGLDLSSWRAAFNGAEAVSPDTLTRFIEHFSLYGFDKKAMMPVYGLAESSVGLAFPPLERGVLINRVKRDTFMRTGKAVDAEEGDTNALRFVSSGVPIKEHQIRVVDLSGRELPERHEGQLQFHGPSSTRGYYRNLQKTETLFDGEWLNTGDLAYISKGELFITGRVKDVIIRAGRNIYPDELEKAISNIAGVRKGCVALFGSTDSKTATERLILLAESRVEDEEERSRLRLEINSLATDLIGTPLDEIVLAPPGSVLKTSSGKVRRSASKDMYESGSIGKKSRSVIWQVIRLGLSAILPQIRRIGSHIKALLFALHVWVVLVVVSPIVWVGGIVLPNYELRWRFMSRCARLIARLTFIEIKVEGFENLTKRRGSYVVVVNHASYIDSIVLASVLPAGIRFVSKAELSDSFLTRLPLEKLHVEFVERFDVSKSVDDANRLLNTLQRGDKLLFFVEGTFSRVPGLRAFHMGAFKAAADASAAVIPISICGSRSILREGSWFPRHGSLTVTVGEAIESKTLAEESEKKKNWDIALLLRERARSFILCNCGEPDLTC